MGGRREKEFQFVDFHLFICIFNFINVYIAGCIGGLAHWRIGMFAYLPGGWQVGYWQFDCNVCLREGLTIG